MIIIDEASNVADDVWDDIKAATVLTDETKEVKIKTRLPRFCFVSFGGKIVSDTGIMDGQPCIKGTRITVDLILSQIQGERTFDEILEDYPHITRTDIAACIEYARSRLG